jgi:hypothetical protein
MKTAFTLFLALGALAQADTLRLRNGETLEGRFISGSETGIWFETPLHEAAVYPLALVESVSFTGGAAGTPSTSQQTDEPKKSNGDALADRGGQIAQQIPGK